MPKPTALNNAAMDSREALETLIAAASSYAENQEEGLYRRIEATDSNAKIEADFADFADEREDALRVRDIWRAVMTVQAILDQRGMAGNSVAPGEDSLVGVIDTAVFG